MLSLRAAATFECRVDEIDASYEYFASKDIEATPTSSLTVCEGNCSRHEFVIAPKIMFYSSF